MNFWNLSVFVPVAAAAQAATLAQAVWPDDPNAGQQLTVALHDGQGAAYLGANAVVSDVEIAQLQGLVEIPDVRWYRWSLDGELGLAFPDGPDEGTPWGWAQSVAAAGLTLPPPTLLSGA